MDINLLTYSSIFLNIILLIVLYISIIKYRKKYNEQKTITSARELLLRNIMHEIKTPITKGLLISNMMGDSKFKDSLKRAFFRLEYLIKEFTRLDKSTHAYINLEKKEFRVIDIIDHALDILLCDINDIDLEVKDNITIRVDYELFSLAIKNLIDNSIKYGEEKPKIILKNNSIYILNKGDKLSNSLESYNKPFNRKYENSDSLGLGIYIINNILKAHNLVLQYQYKDSSNIFYINFHQE